MVRPRNGKWVADVKVGKLPRVRRTFTCKNEAQHFEDMERSRLKREVMLNPDAALAPSVKGETVGKWFPIIAKDLWGSNASDDPNLRNIVRTWIAYLGPNMPLTDIRASHVERYVMVKRSEGKANSTINQFTTRLNKMLKKARRLDLIHTLPEIVSAGRGGKRQRWFTDAEIERLTSAFPPYYQLFVTFLLFTGARLGEAEGVTWRYVADNMVTFKDTKNGEDRTVPMTPQVKAIIKMLRPAGGVRPDQPVFDAYCRSTFYRRWKEAKVAAGLADDPEAVPHTLRHTCASRLVKANVSIATVQKWLGHSDIQMTMRYVHLDMAALEPAVVALAAFE